MTPREKPYFWIVLIIVTAASGRVLAEANGAIEGVDPSRFEVTPLATGLIQPMEIAIAPDGSVYWIELSGKLKRLDPETRETDVVGELSVTTEQENGLIGLALDPNFATNHWVFVQYSPPNFSGQHVSRFTLMDGRLDPTTERVLLRYEEQRKECCHHAGSLAFGPNGDLFISTGDNTHPHGDSEGYAPLDERPGREPYDGQKSASNTQSYNGKILRIRPTADGSYEIPEGNLFPRDGSQGRPEIYVMGCRNPWRMQVDMRTGFVYWGEVGPDAGGDGPRGPRGYDEINQARQAGNFGWPYFIANNLAYHDVDFATREIGPAFDPNAPVNESPNNTGSVRLPPARPAWLYYPGGPSADFPELGQGGRTACAGPVYHFSAESPSQRKFPAAFDGRLFVYEWSRHWIKTVSMTSEGDVQAIDPFLPDQPFVRPIDMAFGPDGALYVLEYGETWGINPDSRLIRIDYMNGNRSPTVVAAAENNIGKEPLTVSLTSQGTTDRDGDLLSYEWRAVRASDPNNPPQILSRDPHPHVTFDQPGVYNVELVVTDSDGAFRTASVPVLVGNAPPVLRFVEPTAGEFFDPEKPIPYELHVQDMEDGTNDYELAEAQGLEPIDPDSPNRISLQVTYTNRPVPPQDSPIGSESGPLGMRMMRLSDCFNCHSVDQIRVGPPLLEIANKYRDKAGALEASIDRVLKGSTGVWGKIPMIPHGQHQPDEIREMVTWIYSLQPNGLTRLFHGFVGEIPLTDEVRQPGYFVLTANYVDRGAGNVPPLTASTTLRLRPRQLEADSADELRGPKILMSTSASQGKFLGSINHGQSIRFNDIPLDRVSRIRMRVASAGAGGVIEARRGGIDGELLGSVEVKVNGSWEDWYDCELALAPASGRHDLSLCFVNPQKSQALLNLDTIDLLP